MCEGISCTTPLQMTQMFTALVTAGVAVIVAIITFQQWITNRATLREKLFERRFDIFKETQQLLTHISMGNALSNTQVIEFLEKAQRSRFFFGTAVYENLLQIHDGAMKLGILESRLKTYLVDSDSWENCSEEIDRIRGLMDQSLRLLFDDFGKYMDFSKSV